MTADLKGAALNWAVARATDELVEIPDGDIFYPNAQFGPEGLFCPVNSWDQAGPIIERFGVRWNKNEDGYYAWIGGHEYIDPLHEPWIDGTERIEWDAFEYGDTLLEAAMRCVVAKEMGDEIAIPCVLVEH